MYYTHRSQVSLGMEREFTRFVEEPSQRNYFAACAAALRLSPRLVAATELLEIERLLLTHDFSAAVERLEALPPSAAFSPRVHQLAAQLALATHDAENIELERFLFVVCLKALLATGSGTEDSPYRVLHVTDQQDVLVSLGIEARKHTLVAHGALALEVVDDEAGNQIWFNVTGLLPPRQIRRRTAPAKSRKNRLAQKH